MPEEHHKCTPSTSQELIKDFEFKKNPKQIFVIRQTDAFYELCVEMLIFEIHTTEVTVCSLDSSYVWCQHERFFVHFVSEIAAVLYLERQTGANSLLV